VADFYRINLIDNLFHCIVWLAL